MTGRTVVIGPTKELSAALADGLDASFVGNSTETLPDADGVVIVVDPDPGPGLLSALHPEEWDRIVNTAMWDTLAVLQRARRSLLQSRGRIVLVVPTIGLAGAARLVGYITALEGVRAMAKSAARQWSSEGISVNVVATALRLFAPDEAAAAAHPSAPAVQDSASLLQSVVESVKFLLLPNLDHVAGETIVVDGGSVMLP